MTAPLLVVTGTGTGIGKTFVAERLLEGWADADRRRGGRGHIVGLKPIETGGREDVDRLARASTFHVTRLTPPYLFADPVSPHLAARREGRAIDLAEIVRWTGEARTDAGVDGVVLELAGGLFSPLRDDATNADLVRLLEASAVVLVAPDRLGVLHDVVATVGAARALAIAIAGVVLSSSAPPDRSSGSNAAELARVLPAVPVLAVLGRDVGPDAAAPAIAALRRALDSG